jgi:drug/metabolite transporter (DMT)-like permease
MEKAIPLALVASLCTATSSVCQRLGARKTQTVDGFDFWLILRLVRRPIWLAGLAAMILGFGFQLTALHYGALALVQPILALELLFVFGYMTFLGNVKVRRRDWLAAAAMSAGLGLFLLAASPSGGRAHAPGYLWVPAALATFGAVVAAIALAFGLHRQNKGSASHRAAVLGIATGISWGFVAAVIKEFSSHLGGGLGGIFTNWSLYALIAAGAASLLLASQALAAGPLAASQPGFTILDPLAATLLGIFLFGERIQAGPINLTFEALALALLVGGVSALSHSHLIVGEDQGQDISKTQVPSQASAAYHSASASSSTAPAYVPAELGMPEYAAAEYSDPSSASGDQPSRSEQ